MARFVWFHRRRRYTRTNVREVTGIDNRIGVIRWVKKVVAEEAKSVQGSYQGIGDHQVHRWELRSGCGNRGCGSGGFGKDVPKAYGLSSSPVGLHYGICRCWHVG